MSRGTFSLLDEYPNTAEAVIIGRYRYLLTRQWAPGPMGLVIMCNPSIADAETDDPTIHRVTSFARREGLGGFRVVNHFALIATDPKTLTDKATDDPIGPYNAEYIDAALRESDTDLVICAWGAEPAIDRTRGAMHGRLKLAKSQRPYLQIKCLGLTKHGHPSHPLYLPADQPLIDYPLRKEETE